MTPRDAEPRDCPPAQLSDLEKPGDDPEPPVVETSLYGKLWAPRTLAEFAALVQSSSLNSDGPLSGWRGQSDASWPLHPGAFRRLSTQARGWLLNGPGVTESVTRGYEDRLLQLARLAGHGFADGRKLADLEVLGVLQHHGAATRLADFTENAFIALWFAASAHPDKDGVVFGVGLDNAWRIGRDEYLQSSFSKLLDEAEGRMTYWKPSALSPRMPAQAAFLLWSEVQGRRWTSLGTQAAIEPDISRTSELSSEFSAIAVSPDLKAYMQHRWQETLGYSQVTMFPDLDGFANANGAGEALPWDFFA